MLLAAKIAANLGRDGDTVTAVIEAVRHGSTHLFLQANLLLLEQTRAEHPRKVHQAAIDFEVARQLFLADAFARALEFAERSVKGFTEEGLHDRAEEARLLTQQVHRRIQKALGLTQDW